MVVVVVVVVVIVVVKAVVRHDRSVYYIDVLESSSEQYYADR